MSHIEKNSYIPIILEFNSAMNIIRWNFFTYSEEKCTLITEIIQLIYRLKNNLPPELNDKLKTTPETLEKKIDAYHIERDLKNESNNFLSYVYSRYDINSNHNEQVCRLLKLLPCCVPLEWELSASYLINDKDPMSVLQLLIDVLLVLSEMSKKSAENHLSLSYCFQRFCVITKEVVYPHIKQDTNLAEMFIKKICRLIKHLPNELHNSIEVSLVNLFDFDVLKSLRNDEDFVYMLVSMSDLEICKIICTKMTS